MICDLICWGKQRCQQFFIFQQKTRVHVASINASFLQHLQWFSYGKDWHIIKVHYLQLVACCWYKLERALDPKLNLHVIDALSDFEFFIPIINFLFERYMYRGWSRPKLTTVYCVWVLWIWVPKLIKVMRNDSKTNSKTNSSSNVNSYIFNVL